MLPPEYGLAFSQETIYQLEVDPFLRIWGTTMQRGLTQANA